MSPHTSKKFISMIRSSSWLSIPTVWYQRVEAKSSCLLPGFLASFNCFKWSSLSSCFKTWRKKVENCSSLSSRVILILYSDWKVDWRNWAKWHEASSNWPRVGTHLDPLQIYCPKIWQIINVGEMGRGDSYVGLSLAAPMWEAIKENKGNIEAERCGWVNSKRVELSFLSGLDEWDTTFLEDIRVTFHPKRAHINLQEINRADDPIVQIWHNSSWRVSFLVESIHHQTLLDSHTTLPVLDRNGLCDSVWRYH